MRKFRSLLALLLAVLALTGCARQTAEPTAEPQLEETTEAEPTTEAAEPPTETTEPPTEPPTEPTTEATEPPPPPIDHALLQSVIDQIAQEYRAMGLQVAVIRNGEIVGSYAYGWAIRDQVPMTVDHKIRVASVTKVSVGIAALALHENGILDINADIGPVWGIAARNPNFPDIPITPYLILSHISSIAAYEEEPSSDYRSVLNRMNRAFWAVEPGVMDSWCYNNYAFRVLGMTLELAADKTMDQIMGQYFFDSMGIEAAYAPGDLKDPSMAANLYNYRTVVRNQYEQQRLHSPTTPGGNGAYFAGGLTISAQDMAKLIAMLANDGMYDGKQYLKPETVALMEAYNEEQLFKGSWQAHPLFFVPGMYDREEVYYHTGYGYGVYSCVCYDNATGDGVVVLTTGATGYKDPYDISQVCSKINDYVYHYLEDLRNQ